MEDKTMEVTEVEVVEQSTEIKCPKCGENNLILLVFKDKKTGDKFDNDYYNCPRCECKFLKK